MSKKSSQNLLLYYLEESTNFKVSDVHQTNPNAATSNFVGLGFNTTLTIHKQ